MKRKMTALKKLNESVFDGVVQQGHALLFHLDPKKEIDEYELAAKIPDKVTLLGYSSEKTGKYRHRILCVDENLDKVYFCLTNKQFKALQREVEHREQRVKDGVSFRDAWNVDYWVPKTCAKILAYLEEDAHGFPPCAVELHKRVIEEVDGKKYVVEDKYKDMNGDDHAWNVYKDDLKRMVFLFSEYDEETCSMKNPYEFRLHWDFVDDPKHDNYKRMEFYGTDEEKAETEKHRARRDEIDKYRSECLHKALKMLNIYIEYLWD